MKPTGGFVVVFHVGHGVMQVGAVLLEKAVDLHGGVEAEHLANVVFGEALAARKLK